MLAGYATHTDAARAAPQAGMEPRYDATTVRQQKRYIKPPFGRRRPLPAAAPRARTGSALAMGRALAVVCAAVACAVAAGAGANEPIAPNELGLTAIDCATQYCTSKDSLLLWLALENTCFSDKQPCAAAPSNFAGPRGCSRRRAGGGGSAAAAARTSPGPRGVGGPRRAARGGSVHASPRRARSSHRFPDAVAFQVLDVDVARGRGRRGVRVPALVLQRRRRHHHVDHGRRPRRRLRRGRALRGAAPAIGGAARVFAL